MWRVNDTASSSSLPLWFLVSSVRTVAVCLCVSSVLPDLVSPMLCRLAPYPEDHHPPIPPSLPTPFLIARDTVTQPPHQGAQSPRCRYPSQDPAPMHARSNSASEFRSWTPKGVGILLGEWVHVVHGGIVGGRFRVRIGICCYGGARVEGACRGCTDQRTKTTCPGDMLYCVCGMVILPRLCSV